MARNSYPTGADLATFLAGAGIISDPPAGIQSLLDLDGKVAAAVDEWERRTGFFPFLQTSATPTARYFDPPGPTRTAGAGWGWGIGGGDWTLELDGGVLAVTQVTVGGSSNPLTISSPADVPAQLWLQPLNAAAEGKPFRKLQFVAPTWGTWGAVAITGVWGYCAPSTVTLPGAFGAGRGMREDAWQAVLNGAAGMTTELPGLVSRGVVSWSEAAAQENYGPKPLEGLMGTWAGRFNAGVRRYMGSPVS